MENNKLIAEFMGSIRFPERDFDITDMIYYEGKGMLGGFLKHFEYHTSWDWLMPVVKKLKTTRKNPEHTFLTVAFGKLNQSLMEAEIEPVYRDVVDIIKLLNQLNP